MMKESFDKTSQLFFCWCTHLGPLCLTFVVTKANLTKGTSKATLAKETSKVKLAKWTSKATMAKGTSKATLAKGTSKATLDKETSKATLAKGISKVTLAKGPRDSLRRSWPMYFPGQPRKLTRQPCPRKLPNFVSCISFWTYINTKAKPLAIWACLMFVLCYLLHFSKKQ